METNKNGPVSCAENENNEYSGKTAQPGSPPLIGEGIDTFTGARPAHENSAVRAAPIKKKVKIEEISGADGGRVLVVEGGWGWGSWGGSRSRSLLFPAQAEPRPAAGCVDGADPQNCDKSLVHHHHFPSTFPNQAILDQESSIMISGGKIISGAPEKAEEGWEAMAEVCEADVDEVISRLTSDATLTGLRFLNVVVGACLGRLGAALCGLWRVRELAFLRCRGADSGPLDASLLSLSTGMRGTTRLVRVAVSECALTDQAVKPIMDILHRSAWLRAADLSGNPEAKSMIGHNAARFEQTRAAIDRPVAVSLARCPAAEVQAARSYRGKEPLRDWLAVPGNVEKHWGLKGRGLSDGCEEATCTLDRSSGSGVVTLVLKHPRVGSGSPVTVKLPPGAAHRAGEFCIMTPGDSRPLLVAGPRCLLAGDDRRFPAGMALWISGFEAGKALGQVPDRADREALGNLMRRSMYMSSEELKKRFTAMLDATFNPQGGYICAVETITAEALAMGNLRAAVAQDSALTQPCTSEVERAFSRRPAAPPVPSAATRDHHNVFAVLLEDLPIPDDALAAEFPAASSLHDAIRACAVDVSARSEGAAAAAAPSTAAVRSASAAGIDATTPTAAAAAAGPQHKKQKF